MANFRLIFAATIGEFDKAFRSMSLPIANAATLAIREAGAILKTEAKADVAGAGFSRRWVSAIKVQSYPKGAKRSINAAAYLNSSIPYAVVFETGANIRGRPLLWIPLSSAPQKIGTKRITPKLFEQSIGPLVFVKRAGKPPLLVAARAKTRSKKTNITIGSLRKGAARAGVTTSVPIFVGVDVVRLRKRFHITAIANRIRDRLGEFYFDNFKDE